MLEAPPETAPAPAAPPPPARPRRLRRFLKFAARLGLLLALCVIGIAVVLFFAPLSFAWSDRLIKDKWLEATGLRLDFTRAEWSASRGHILIEKPVLYDAGTGENLIDLESFELRLDLLSLARAAWKRERRIDIPQIMLAGPLWIGFEEREGKFAIQEKLGRAIRTASEKLRASSKSGVGARIGQASLTSLFISVDRVAPDGTAPLLLVQNADAIVEFNDLSEPMNVVLVGALRGEGGATIFNLMLQPRMGQDEISADLSLQPFDSTQHLMADLATDFRTSPVKARGNIRREADGHWALYSSATIPELTLVAAGPRGEDQSFSDAALAATLDWRETEKRIDLRAFELKSSHLDIAATGSLALAEPHAYRAALAPATLRGRGLALLERGIFGENRITKPDEGVFRVAGEVSGRVGEARFDSFVGRVSLSDVSFAMENLPEPVLGVRLEADVTTTTLSIADAYGVFQGVPVSVTGSMTGRPAEGRIDSADLAWQTTGDLAGISDLIARNGEGPATDMTFKGKVTGQGHLRVKNPKMEDWAKVVEDADFGGRFMFDDAELTHREVARPVRSLSGTFEFDRKRAVLTGISGELEDIAFSLSGTMEGPARFWENASANIALEAQVDLARIEEYCDWFQADRPKLPPRTGKARLEAKLRGPLGEPAKLAYEGRLAAADFSLTPEHDRIAGTIRFPELEAEFTSTSVRVPQTRGDWEGIGVIADAEFAPGGGTLRVKAEGPMTAYRKTLTGVLGEFSEIGGEATADFTFGVARADGSAPAATFTDLWNDLAAKTKAPDFRIEDHFKPTMQGEAKLIDATLLFDTMPPSAILTGIYGTLLFDNDGLRTAAPAQIKAGEGAVNTMAEARIGFPKEGVPTVLDFTLTGSRVDLDSWVKKWVKVPPNPRRRRITGSPFDDAAQPKTQILVRAQSDEVRFRGVDGRNLTGTLEFATYGPRRTKLAWTDATADFKQGSMRLSGDWTREMEHERMRHSATATGMDVADIFTMAYKQPRQGGLETGRVTGFAELLSEGEGGRAPYSGRGRVLVTDSRFISSSLFGVLGGALGLESFFQEISFSKIEGDFTIAENAVRTENLLFEHPLKIHPLNLRMSGTIGPERKLDLDVHLQFLPVVGEIPIIGAIWKRINELTGKVLKYRVSGTLETPALAEPAAGAAP